MSFEELKAGIGLLLAEIVRRPHDAHELQEQLREQLAEYRALGLPVPKELEALERYLEEDDAEFPPTDMPL
jgi:hypothetical protein